MLSMSDAFYVKECEHGQILKENFVNKLKNDKTIISPELIVFFNSYASLIYIYIYIYILYSINSEYIGN